MAIARRMAALPQLPPEAQNLGSYRPSASASSQSLVPLQAPSQEQVAEEMEALKEELAEMPDEMRPSLTREFSGSSTNENLSVDQLKRMHANLDLRLQPFWASAVTNRPVTLSIFSGIEGDKDGTIDATSYTPLESGRQPLFTVQTSTDAQGIFSQQIMIPYETLCTNPEGLGIAFESFETEPRVRFQALRGFND